MAESIIEQASERLKSNLAAITADGGTTYWYTPISAWRVPYYEDRHLDSSRPADRPIVLIRAGDEFHEEAAAGLVKATAEVYVLTAVPFKPPTELPWSASTPHRMTVVNRLVRDVLRAIWADPQLGGLVENVAYDPVTVDRERETEGRAMAEIRLSIRYSYERTAP